MSFRFTVGTEVLCRTGENDWAKGTIVALRYADPGWPPGKTVPYKVQLEDRLIFVPVDSDEICRLYIPFSDDDPLKGNLRVGAVGQTAPQAPKVPTQKDKSAPSSHISRQPVDKSKPAWRIAIDEVLKFVAYWFSVARFDADGDGDFGWDEDTRTWRKQRKVMTTLIKVKEKTISEAQGSYGKGAEEPQDWKELGDTSITASQSSGIGELPSQSSGPASHHLSRGPSKASIVSDGTEVWQDSSAITYFRSQSGNFIPSMASSQSQSLGRASKASIVSDTTEVWQDSSALSYWQDSTGSFIPSMPSKASTRVSAISEVWEDPTVNGIHSMDLGRRPTRDSNGDGKMDNCDGQKLEKSMDACGMTKDEGPSTKEMSTHKPFFICLYSILILVFWFSGSLKVNGSKWLDKLGGLESYMLGKTMMQTYYECVDQRAEVWRWFSYQFSHGGMKHALFNTVLNLFLGIPIERSYGGLRMAFVYELGVLGGALCLFVADSHTSMVGCSGGAYSLYGMHLATVSMNWHKERYKKPVLLFLACLLASDMVVVYSSPPGDRMSHAAHFGGYLAGTVSGVLFGINLQVKRSQVIFQIVTFFLGFALALFSLIWLFAVWPPQTLWESDGWCWRRRVQSPRMFNSTEFQCVSCDSLECVDRIVKHCIDCVTRQIKDAQCEDGYMDL